MTLWRRTATLVVASATMLAFSGCRTTHTTVIEPVKQEPAPQPDHHDDHHDDHRDDHHPPPPPDRR